MTETNGERLERIQNINDLKHVVALHHPSDDSYNPNTVDLESDIDWLIEQAELRQIENQASVLANKINTAYTKEVRDENERLRDVLKVVRNNMFNAVTVYGIKNLVLEIVDQALEESK